jgi:hypothetical protein
MPKILLGSLSKCVMIFAIIARQPSKPNYFSPGWLPSENVFQYGDRRRSWVQLVESMNVRRRQPDRSFPQSLIPSWATPAAANLSILCQYP